MRSFSLSPHLGQEHSGLSQNAVPWRRGRTGNMLLACDPEWLIGVGRLVTSLFAVVAMHLDPTQPAAFRHESKVIIGLYVAFSLLMVLFPLRRPLDSKDRKSKRLNSSH